jgi:hypothetical protein
MRGWEGTLNQLRQHADLMMRERGGRTEELPRVPYSRADPGGGGDDGDGVGGVGEQRGVEESARSVWMGPWGTRKFRNGAVPRRAVIPWAFCPVGFYGLPVRASQAAHSTSTVLAVLMEWASGNWNAHAHGTRASQTAHSTSTVHAVLRLGVFADAAGRLPHNCCNGCAFYSILLV